MSCGDCQGVLQKKMRRCEKSIFVASVLDTPARDYYNKREIGQCPSITEGTMSREDREVLDAKIAEGEKRVKKEKREKRKKQAESFWGDFKKFITRGNIVDMAIGVIVASAFTAIVTSLSNQIIKPIVNWLLALILGQNSLSEIYTFLKRVNLEDGTADLANSIYIDWGAFINAILNFLIIAMCLFIILRIATKAHKKFTETVNAAKLAEEKAAAEKKEAEEKAAAAEKAAAEAQAAAEKAETERQFYENVRRQTELLEKIAAAQNK